MAYNKEQAIAAQNAGSTAAALVSAMVTANILTTEDDALSVFEDVRKLVFDGTLAYAGAETTIESIESTPRTNGARRKSSSGNGDGKADPGSVVLRFGKHKGKTISDVYDEEPDWLQWAADNSNNVFIARVAGEYLEQVA